MLDMVGTVRYTENVGIEGMSTVAVQGEIQSSMAKAKKRGRPRKSKQGANTMADETTVIEGTDVVANEEQPEQEQDGTLSSTVQKTVFDLTEFAKILLTKNITYPKKPETLEEAQQLVGGDTKKLLAIIYDGMKEETRRVAREDMSGGWHQVVNDEPLEEEYKGSWANDDKMKLINGVVLNLAKMNGWDQSLPIEKRNEIQDKVRKWLKDNPAMIQGI